jgi:glyoxylate/hydroxypyruvate reductase A
MPSQKNHRLLIYHRDPELYEEAIRRRAPRLEIHSTEKTDEALFWIEEAEILLAWKLPDDLLKKARKLAWFASTGAGNEHLVNNPHLPETVIVTKTTIYGEMMAEYVFAYILYFIRRGAKHLEDQRRGVWDPVRPERLRGKVLAVLGLGSIGREIAKRGRQFGMKVIGLKRSPEPVEEVGEAFGPSDLEEMIPIADYLVNCLPYTPETYHFLGQKELALLKEGAVLFSIGRGKTIDQEALVRVLRSKKIRAVLDVFETEPLPRESKLWTLENVIITPHVSGINMPEEICEAFVDNYERWLRGGSLVGVVDRKKGY